jgi:predicted nucleic acid-binding Zn finger protein
MGGASLGATGAKPHFIFGGKKREWIFEKQFIHCSFYHSKKVIQWMN